MLLRLVRRLLRAPKTACRSAPASAPAAAKHSFRRRAANRFRAPSGTGNDMRRTRTIARGNLRQIMQVGKDRIGSMSTNTSVLSATPIRNSARRIAHASPTAGGRRNTASPRRSSRACWRARTAFAQTARSGPPRRSASITATKPAWCEACSAASATPGWDASTTARRSCSRPWRTFTGTRREKSVPGSQPGGRSSRISGRCPADRSLAIGYAGAPATRGLAYNSDT